MLNDLFFFSTSLDQIVAFSQWMFEIYSNLSKSLKHSTKLELFQKYSLIPWFYYTIIFSVFSFFFCPDIDTTSFGAILSVDLLGTSLIYRILKIISNIPHLKHFSFWIFNKNVIFPLFFLSQSEIQMHRGNGTDILQSLALVMYALPYSW